MTSEGHYLDPNLVLQILMFLKRKAWADLILILVVT